MSSPEKLAGKRLAIVVTGAAGPEDLLNQVLEPRGFAPVLFAASLAELTTQLRSRAPALVIVPIPAGGSSSDLSLFAAELRRHPATAAIGTSNHKDADTVLGAMRSGIPEFVLYPLDSGEFVAAVSRVLSNLALPQQSGSIFSVYSGKGGVGTSTIATSLAWSLAHSTKERQTALVDFNTAGAGIRVMLNLNPSYDLGSVAARAARLDSDYLQSVMTATSERVTVLSAADELDAVEPLDSKTSGQLVELLRQQYAYTVIDTDHHFNDQTLAALDAADRILLVTQCEVSALRSTQRSLGMFARLGYPAEKVLLIANRRTERDRITVDGAAEVLGRAISFWLPNDYTTCSGAITQGQFAQRFAPASPLVESFGLIARSLNGQGSAAAVNGKPSQPSRLSRLFGRT